jgi:hypothetical protein
MTPERPPIGLYIFRHGTGRRQASNRIDGTVDMAKLAWRLDRISAVYCHNAAAVEKHKAHREYQYNVLVTG